MQITRVCISTQLSQRDDGRLLAFGSVEFDNELRVEYIRVVKTNDGRILICMPSIINSGGLHRDTVHPIRKELRQRINEAILDELKKSRPGDWMSKEPLTKSQ